MFCCGKALVEEPPEIVAAMPADSARVEKEPISLDLVAARCMWATRGARNQEKSREMRPNQAKYG